MDKISFLIPNNNESSKIIQSNNTINDEKTNNPIVKNKRMNDYEKITTNVYRFTKDNVLNWNDNIYILYEMACQEKQLNQDNAIKMFKKCRELITEEVRENIKYEILINLALLVSATNHPSGEEISVYYQEALSIFPDRAEPYYYWGILCNKIGNFEKSYELLKKALLLSYEEAKVKYPGTQFLAYGKYLLDELAVSCYWLKKYEEAKTILESIVDDPDFIILTGRERLEKNLKYTKEAILTGRERQ